ncbi:MAG: tRNA uridine-5-carboxymethylaminomethyl(34) synthesis GTPase MnmE [Magnetococcales bacterium]|nr:tRNA uridine-5-carboxymethylaminomethyl(34) synthesis GTPase MnmE [Magnetococcales bacterium]
MLTPRVLDAVDPIAGLATPPGTSAVAVIRLSGAGVPERLLPLLRHPDGRAAHLDDFLPRQLRRMDLVDDQGRPLDQAMLVYFAAPRSYTGEEMVELHCHGSPVVVGHVLERLTRLGVRTAQPGEFTRRAVRNGKLDLTQAEALANLINAATLRAARESLRQMEGSLSRRIATARERLTEVLAHLEAGLDFADEEVEPQSRTWMANEVAAVMEGLGALLRGAPLGAHLRDGFQLVIAGRPNVGKSSLFNQLLGRQRAIVTPLPGTTRDCIEGRLELRGIPVILIDTAGVRDGADAVEAEGIRLTRERMAEADGVVLVLDAGQGVVAGDLELARLVPAGRGIVAWNKMDLCAAGQPPAMELGWPQARLCCLTGDGLEELLTAISGLFLPVAEDGEGAVIMAVRQREALMDTVRSLAECEALLIHDRPGEVVAMALRSAVDALGELAGHITHDVVLERIFSNFCIGK